MHPPKFGRWDAFLSDETQGGVCGNMKLRTLLLLSAGVAVGRMMVAKPRIPLATVPHVDVEQYLGRWYEIAHYPARFERKCVANAMANYSLRSDGKIDVLNTCRREDGSVKKTKATAEIADPNTNAKLKVTFLWPFSGEYWILDLASDYSYAAVGEPINLAGAQRLCGKDTAVYQIAYGNGIERYINDTSGLGLDAAVSSLQNPHIQALPVVATYGAIQHFWSERMRSSIMYSFVQVQNTEAQVSSVYHQGNYTAGNLLWNPFGSLTVGAEFLYGWRDNKDGSTGNAPRVQFSAKYNFVRNEYAGEGH
jgi:lipocalin